MYHHCNARRAVRRTGGGGGGGGGGAGSRVFEVESKE